MSSTDIILTVAIADDLTSFLLILLCSFKVLSTTHFQILHQRIEIKLDFQMQLFDNYIAT